jgi:hypothetical protein
MLLSASALTTPAVLALGETEPNHPIDTAQRLTIVSQTTTIDGVLGNGGPGDVDYFAFSGKAGDVVTLDIDRGAGDASSVDTVLAIFGPGPAYSMLRLNDDAPLDPGSVSTRDARIEKFVLPQTGRYVVGVSNYPRYFLSGGTVRTGSAAGGDYQLLVSGVSPSVKQIAIEVKPGSEDVAPINPRSKGKIPVALLGGPDFEVMSVDPASLTFGATGGEASLVKCEWTGNDINGDGRVDRVCHFDNEKANFKLGDLEGVLRGRTRDGMMIEGRAFLKVVPQKAE